MRAIEVFYHIFIPADIRATMWTWYVDQQLQLIKKSKLPEVAEINVAITMPRDWNQIVMPFRPNGDDQTNITFEQKVREYINTRFPWANIIDVRDIDPNIFEGQTLELIWEHAQHYDFDICYVHSKGVVSASPSVGNWREILNHYCITEWPTCIKLLEQADAVGLKDKKSLDFTFSGNFWWSKSEHIRTLPDPIDSTVYTTNSELFPGGPGYRYAFEYWVRSNNPKVDYIIDTETDHFNEYCFLEDLLKKNR